MVTIQELKPGDELFFWMRLGLALTSQRQKDGSILRIVPSKPQKIRAGDLSNGAAWVVSNSPETASITLFVCDLNSQYKGNDSQGNYKAVVPYHAFSRVERLSKYNYPGLPNPASHPTKSGFKRPFRTREEVRLTS